GYRGSASGAGRYRAGALVPGNVFRLGVAPGGNRYFRQPLQWRWSPRRDAGRDAGRRDPRVRATPGRAIWAVRRATGFTKPGARSRVADPHATAYAGKRVSCRLVPVDRRYGGTA